MRRIVLAALGSFTLAGAPALAEELKPHEAKAFVVGRTFSFTCFEGTFGKGRIHADGSVAGSITLKNKPQRHVRLPPDTLRVRDGAVCGYLKGLGFEPCFDVVKTGPVSFRGTLAGVRTMWCDFTREGTSRPRVASRRNKE